MSFQKDINSLLGTATVATALGQQVAKTKQEQEYNKLSAIEKSTFEAIKSTRGAANVNEKALLKEVKEMGVTGHAKVQASLEDYNQTFQEIKNESLRYTKRDDMKRAIALATQEKQQQIAEEQKKDLEDRLHMLEEERGGK